jgi:hypothetical protein
MRSPHRTTRLDPGTPRSGEGHIRTIVAPGGRIVALPDSGARVRVAALAAALALAAMGLLCSCGTTQPTEVSAGALAEAQSFPYYRVYWTGTSFQGHRLTGVNGREAYSSPIGDSVYYGYCVSGKGALQGGGSCGLPLQVTTLVYVLHPNAALGAQRNVLLRGVPATIYDEGRSIDLYSGRLAIEIHSDTPAHALLATAQLTPLNAPREPSSLLPQPVYCPGMSGPLPAQLRRDLDSLPGRPCQRGHAALAERGRLGDTLVDSPMS